MADMPWFKFFTQDWIAGTAGLSMAEKGAYITLLAMMYENGGKIIRDDSRLARKCGCPTPNFRAALDALIDDGKIIEADGFLTNKRVQTEVMARENKGAMARKSAASRWDKSQQNQSPKNADAMRTHTESRIQSPDIEKDTPIGVSKKKAPDGASSAEVISPLAEILPAELAQAVVDHRRKIRKPLTAYAAKLLAKDIANCPDPIAAAETMIANGWQGVKAEWMENRKARAGPSGGFKNGLAAVVGNLIQERTENGIQGIRKEGGNHEDAFRLSFDGFAE